jgi:hypothetical protein
MIDEQLARLRAHRNNVIRYNRLLKTQLSDLERQFIERRMAEERSAFQELSSNTFPLTLADASSGAGAYGNVSLAGS